MTNMSHAEATCTQSLERDGKTDSTHVVYLVACDGERQRYVKIGRSCNLQRRLVNIQTGCPHRITHVFVMSSEYAAEIVGLEAVLHQLLRPFRLRGEWYRGSAAFLRLLDTALTRINIGDLLSYEDIQTFPGSEAELEILMHRHAFAFASVALPLRGRQPLVATPVAVEDIARFLRGRAVPEPT